MLKESTSLKLGALEVLVALVELPLVFKAYEDIEKNTDARESTGRSEILPLLRYNGKLGILIGNSTGNPGVSQANPDPNPQKPIPVPRVRVFAGWGHGFHGFHGSYGFHASSHVTYAHNTSTMKLIQQTTSTANTQLTTTPRNNPTPPRQCQWRNYQTPRHGEEDSRGLEVDTALCPRYVFFHWVFRLFSFAFRSLLYIYSSPLHIYDTVVPVQYLWICKTQKKIELGNFFFVFFI